MILVADESIDRQIVDQLRNCGYRVISVAEMDPGMTDAEVFELANAQDALLITADKDFGEIVFRQRRVNRGVILVRLAGLPQENRNVQFIYGHYAWPSPYTENEYRSLIILVFL